MSEYHIEKNRRSIFVTTSSGEEFTGDIFLQAYGRYGGGAERPIDMLNAAENFFPLRLEGGETVLMSKDQVATVTCDACDDEDDIERQITRQVTIEIRLTSGEVLNAAVHLDVPEDHPRLLDFLNLRKLRFLPFETERKQLLVNRSKIERVRSLD